MYLLSDVRLFNMPPYNAVCFLLVWLDPSWAGQQEKGSISWHAMESRESWQEGQSSCFFVRGREKMEANGRKREREKSMVSLICVLHQSVCVYDLLVLCFYNPTSWPAWRCPGIRAPRWSLSLRFSGSAQRSRFPITQPSEMNTIPMRNFFLLFFESNLHDSFKVVPWLFTLPPHSYNNDLQTTLWVTQRCSYSFETFRRSTPLSVK